MSCATACVAHVGNYYGQGIDSFSWSLIYVWFERKDGILTCSYDRNPYFREIHSFLFSEVPVDKRDDLWKVVDWLRDECLRLDLEVG